MAAEEGDVFRETTLLIDGDDRKSTSSAGFPIDGYVFRICLSGGLVGGFGIVRRALLTLMRLVSQAFFEMRRLS